MVSVLGVQVRAETRKFVAPVAWHMTESICLVLIMAGPVPEQNTGRKRRDAHRDAILSQ